ncbi:PREDICTED: bone marrow stromal antigen 2 [Myotis davidii]|uniref:bone marrow stromal antigen 2 n=1 Tax=Myotis davidii TaxID=225400 RepID=UPI000767A825|nr:PREDICTED: bone marrow stromal antigen 2 [Myotis davidii]
MAPTFYCHPPVPMDEYPKKLGDRKLPVREGIVGILLGLLVVGLSVAVGVLAAKANSPACKDGLRADFTAYHVHKQSRRSVLHLQPNVQLFQVRKKILSCQRGNAATCNQTVETLKISLEKQQELFLQKLQEEIKTLNQSLKEKSAELEEKSTELEKKSEELEQLRKENEALVSAKGPPNSGITLSFSVVAVLLPMSLLALLA